jgi:hypothetical protein
MKRRIDADRASDHGRIAALAPMLSASVATAIAVNAGAQPSSRSV